ncbi:Sugar transport protein 7 [Zostera marina]|uniref:Sugar transport protein 7 n=1 Tax=Zostera marina TaxID=29655 RepID=A0A0K9PQ93_ZOSMR|nr:Sugar transport protein 7 [Zostera marina]
MAGGGYVDPPGVKRERADEYEGRVTSYVFYACCVAAVGGSIFGYDIGVSGGVTSMEPFLMQFFPALHRRKKNSIETDDGSNTIQYCRYEDQTLAAFTSSLYLAGLVSSFLASPVTRTYGRRMSIICGGISFVIGTAMNAMAVNLTMLILGRVMLGVGVGFANQAVPVYLSEMAPTKLRGGMNMLFQLATTLGIVCANLINYGTEKMGPWGWRVSLGLAAVPALFFTVGGYLLPETPNSLIERGFMEEGRWCLEKIRGTSSVDAEFQDMVEASEIANSIEHPFRNILEKKNRPQLAMAVLMPMFQILTGINSVLFYAPVLFQSIGFGSNAALYSSVITGAVMFLSTLVSIATVDWLGRRVLLIGGGIQMIISQVIVAFILRKSGEEVLPKEMSVAVVVLICLFVAGFGWSWGPLGWTVPSEIFSLETRSAGQSITVAVNLLFTFGVAQSFLTMLCSFRYGIFLLFAGWGVIMTAFVIVLLPETKGVPIEEMMLLWSKHPIWNKFMPQIREPDINNC